MKTCRLPEELRPYKSHDLARLGRRYDGGYLVNKKDVSDSKLLISMGIENDWSFERDFSAINDIPMRCFDASVNGASIRAHLKRRRFRLDRPSLIWEAYYNYKTYHKFFDGTHRQHIRKFVGKQGSVDSLAFTEACNDDGANPFFLKIDIEGDEYEVLQDLLKIASQTSGLAIEFHGVSKKRETILDFIRNYTLKLTHTHINNCAGMDNDGLPELIELTFSKSCNEQEKVVTLPNLLDMSNSPKLKQWAIEFVA